jgi:hypothetical protein
MGCTANLKGCVIEYSGRGLGHAQGGTASLENGLGKGSGLELRYPSGPAFDSGGRDR